MMRSCAGSSSSRGMLDDVALNCLPFQGPVVLFLPLVTGMSIFFHSPNNIIYYYKRKPNCGVIKGSTGYVGVNRVSYLGKDQIHL